MHWYRPELPGNDRGDKLGHDLHELMEFLAIVGSWYLPSMHLTQALFPSPQDPAGHASHVDAPAKTAHEPAAHGVQAFDASTELDVPGEHCGQSEDRAAPTMPCVPIGHDAEPSSVVDPAGQM